MLRNNTFERIQWRSRQIRFSGSCCY